MVRFIAAVMAFIQAIMIYFGSTGVNTQKWKLEKIPAYEGGVVCETVYDTGSGLLADKDGPTASDGKMQLVSATNLEEYHEYLEVLRMNGFEEVYSNELEGVVCNAFRKDGKLVYYYCDIIHSDYYKDENKWIFTDLLADVKIYPDGRTEIVDLDEASEALKSGIISTETVCELMENLNSLLGLIYSGEWRKLTERFFV